MTKGFLSDKDERDEMIGDLITGLRTESVQATRWRVSMIAIREAERILAHAEGKGALLPPLACLSIETIREHSTLGQNGANVRAAITEALASFVGN